MFVTYEHRPRILKGNGNYPIEGSKQYDHTVYEMVYNSFERFSCIRLL